MTEELEEVEEPQERVIEPWVAQPDISASSVGKFLKLGEKHGLIIRVQGTKILAPAEVYAADSKATGARKGDVKKPERELELLSITMTNGLDFAALATWEDGTFKHCLIGGKRSGYRPEKYFRQSTITMKEIARCLA